MATKTTAARAKVATTRAITPNAAKKPAPKPAPKPITAHEAHLRHLHVLHVAHVAHVAATAKPKPLPKPKPKPLPKPAPKPKPKAAAKTTKAPGIVVTHEGGTRGGLSGGYGNSLSGDILGHAGLAVPKLAEYALLAIAAWLVWKYLGKKGGKRG